MYPIETLRYLPKWMDPLYPPVSGSLLATFWVNSLLESYVNITKDLKDMSGGLTYSSYGQPRVGWICYIDKTPATSLSISYFYSTPSSSGTTSGTIRQSASLYDFFHSIDPVFYHSEDNKLIYFRNLEVKIINTTPASDYSISIDSPIDDCDIWYKQGRTYERIDAQSENIDYSNNKVYVPRNSYTNLVYSSKAALNSIDASGVIKINTGPKINITPIDFLNFWDSHAAIFNTKRYPRESNVSIYNRIHLSNLVTSSSKLDELLVSLSREFDTIISLTWVPSSILNLNTLGLYDISSINIIGVEKEVNVIEDGIKVTDNIYKLTKVPIEGTLRLLTAGYYSVPASSISNLLIFYDSPQNNFKSVYRYRNYEIVKDTTGFIQQVVPVEFNMPQNPVLVILTKAIRNYSLNSTEYLTRLLNGDNTPTDYLLRLTKNIQDLVKITYNYVTWDKVHFFKEEEDKPELFYVSRILDP